MHSYPLFVASVQAIMLLLVITSIYKQQPRNKRYYLLLCGFILTLCVQSVTSLQQIQQLFAHQYLELVVGAHLILWALSWLLAFFCLLVIAYALFGVALVCALIANLMLLFTGMHGHDDVPFVHIQTINWHIVGAALSLVLLSATALYAYFIHRLERKLKNALFLEGDMIIALPLDSMQTMLKALSWVSWVMISATLISGYLFTESLLEQKLWHKVVFTAVAWCALSVFLVFNHTRFISHTYNNRFLYTSTCAVFIGYFGTKLVIYHIL